MIFNIMYIYFIYKRNIFFVVFRLKKHIIIEKLNKRKCKIYALFFYIYECILRIHYPCIYNIYIYVYRLIMCTYIYVYICVYIINKTLFMDCLEAIHSYILHIHMCVEVYNVYIYLYIYVHHKQNVVYG